MLLTRESDYALRILRSLQDGSLKTVDTLCEEEYIPKQFTYKILKKLSNASFVEIIQGAHGGTKLAANLNLVSLYDVCQAVGDKITLNACLSGGYVCNWEQTRKKACVFHKKLFEINAQIVDLMKNAKISDILISGVAAF